jgi:hypothetical protein
MFDYEKHRPNKINLENYRVFELIYKKLKTNM